MPIHHISTAVRSYLSSFDSIAIALTSRGSIITTPNPSGYECCWWVRKADAERLVEAARERGNVEATAKRLGITLTSHMVALAKVDRSLARLDGILAEAKRNGDLKQFNSTYRAKREAAVAAGVTFMPYTAAEKRLKRALVEAIADGTQGRPFQFALARVFEQPSR
jgi:hypothetical protein